MKYCLRSVPNNPIALGVLGYLIVINQQVHKYQLDALVINLDSIGVSIEESVLTDIIDGNDSAIEYSSALDAFADENVQIQEDIYHMMLVLSQLDNVIDDKEKYLLSEVFAKSKISIGRKDELEKEAHENALAYRNEHNLLFTNTNMPPKRKFKLFKDALVRLWSKFCGRKLIEEPADDTAYKRIIQRCADIAKEDYGVVHPCYKEIINNNILCMDSLERYKKSLSQETEISAEVASIVKTYLEAVNANVVEQTKKAEISLSQKKRTIPDFTISLLGRTKAGKSTLFAILTNQGYDKIGVGKQRTTRYNRVYQWNLVRLIDTPGIGSAEAAGRTDEEIAQSVLGESDVVCLVVVDDSILKDVLDLMDKVAKLNKPIIILLNHKENITKDEKTKDVKYRRFLADPNRWRLDAGESNIQGHIDRIKRYAESKGYKERVSVYPVFLLAALMSFQKEYADDKAVLWRSSNVEAFVNLLKNWIIYSGTIKRSQTILDEAVQIFKQSKDIIDMAIQPIRRHIDYLEQSRIKNIDMLKKERNNTVGAVKKTYRLRLLDLANIDALDFAEKVYNQKNIPEKWTQYLKEIEFEENLTSEISQECSMFVSKADSVVQELFEDLYFKMKNEFTLPNIKVPLQIDFKSIVRLTGGALSVAGAIILVVLGTTNPVGWVFSIAGILTELASSLFSSKEKRRQKAINKIHQSIRKNILDNLDKQTNKVGEQVAEELNKQISNVDKVYSDLISGLNEMCIQSSKMSNGYLVHIEWLNKVFAWRIVQFLNNHYEKMSRKLVNDTIKLVDRNFKGLMRISVSKRYKTTNAEQLEGILTDKIEFI